CKEFGACEAIPAVVAVIVGSLRLGGDRPPNDPLLPPPASWPRWRRVGRTLAGCNPPRRCGTDGPGPPSLSSGRRGDRGPLGVYETLRTFVGFTRIGLMLQ